MVNKCLLSFMLVAGFLISGCGTLTDRQYAMVTPGIWTLREEDGTKVKVQANESGDSVMMLPYDMKVPQKTKQRQVLTAVMPDIDVFTTPFKLRRARGGIPMQLTTEFNASIYAGVRKDHITMKTIGGAGKTLYRVKKFGYGAGLFGGIGSALIRPEYLRTFTSNPISYEYQAPVINYGIAFLAGYRNISTGLAVGSDLLTDKHRLNWIYQNDVWLGIFVGLNIN